MLHARAALFYFNPNTLLLLYDDAQSIYHRSNLGFTLSRVGVQARGRTTVLKLNYRNTRQILQFAYEFAQHYLQEHASDEDHLPLIKPESGGVNGALPIVREFSNPDDEARFIARCISKWHQDGCELRDIAVVYRSAWINLASPICSPTTKSPKPSTTHSNHGCRCSPCTAAKGWSSTA